MKRIFADARVCLACRSCELACAVERGSISKRLSTAISEDPVPRSRVSVISFGKRGLAVHCRHCQDAPCLDACPGGALWREPEGGLVLHREDRCIGCWMCVMACPFGVITSLGDRGISQKCDQCYGREYPACVDACPTGALILSEPDEFEDLIQRRRAECPEGAEGWR